MRRVCVCVLFEQKVIDDYDAYGWCEAILSLGREQERE